MTIKKFSNQVQSGISTGEPSDWINGSLQTESTGAFQTESMYLAVLRVDYNEWDANGVSH